MTVVRTNPRVDSRVAIIKGEILLVEDQRSLAQMAAKMLHERWGCNVLIATSLEDVRAIIAQGGRHFFVAVSDLNLPDAPNGEVIDVLIAANIPVIAMTGAFDDDMYEVFMSKGMVDYVLKSSHNSYAYVTELIGRLHKNQAIKVLVIDDSEGVCRMITQMLERQKLQVLTAKSAEEGLRILEAQPDIRLVLVDHVMPGIDGFTFVISVRRKFGKERLGIIGISGAENRRWSAKFLKYGADDFIFKPFSYEELMCRVNQNLEMMEKIDEMRQIAFMDFLTGLPNRRFLFDKGRAMHAQAISNGSSLQVAMLDIDFFKKINDTYGHECGDEVLKHMGRLLARHFKDDFVARVGGEEFVVLIGGRETAQAVTYLEAFREAVKQMVVRYGELRVSFTVSIGVTGRVLATLDETLKCADENLYQAKERGRDRVVND